VFSAQLIIDPPSDGAWNMALDEALLHQAEHDGTATLRFYAWREPTLSLGYFQKHADRTQHLESANCRLVRRASGGGAILHDRELTYSIALPSTHRLAVQAEPLYLATHRSLIAALAELGVVATLCEPISVGERRVSDEPFLCFERRTFGDVLVGESKIAGSAQRRHRGAVLQHGSVLLAQSEFAPELPGVADLAGAPISIEELLSIWQPLLAESLLMDFQQSTVSGQLAAQAGDIRTGKFASDDWTLRR
jgi:lipoate-protein ligase A